jgi:prophage antirepressor-like protein
MDEIQIFNSNDFGAVRTMEKDGEPYFCLADVCRILEIKNVSDCKSRLKPDGATVADVKTNGGTQKASFINESNLYRVIFQSKKPGAEKFTDWITETVIPSIRKNGIYSINSELSPQLQLMQSMVNQMAKQEIDIKRANEKSDKAIETVNRMKDEILAPLGDWRRDVNERVRTIAHFSNIPYQALFDEMYSQLEIKAHCNLETLKKNKAARMEKAGQTKTCIKNETTKLAVIEGNDRLREIFSGIVREYSAKYLV